MRIGAAILSEDRNLRLETARATPLDTDGIFALRNALAVDGDAEVRGVAAERLGLVDVVRDLVARTAVRVALLDALGDASPFVRERAAITAGRHLRAPSTTLPAIDRLLTARLVEITLYEPMWRVRRASVRALAVLERGLAAPLLATALDDPFWRVRYAAIQALAPWRDVDLVAEGEIVSTRKSSAIGFLRSLWSGERVDIPREADDASTVRAGPLADDDPAVVAVRLSRLPDAAVSGADLVAMLASPHDVLRRIAMKRLAAREKPAELRAALELLEEPRTPYANAAVRRVLARVDSRALRAAIQSDASVGPALLAWTYDEGRAAREDMTTSARVHVTHADVRVRRAAARSLAACLTAEGMGALEEGLHDADDDVRATCLGALAHVAVTQGGEGAGPLEKTLAETEPLRESPTVQRALALAAASLLVAVPTQHVEGALERFLVAWDPIARATAIDACSEAGTLDAIARARAGADADPWCRLAALDPPDASRAIDDDLDPGVRRGAFERLERAVRSRGADPIALATAATSDDAWIRSRATRAMRPSLETIEALLRLTRDAAPMVRGTAAESLAKVPDVALACLAIVGRDPPVDDELRLAAHGRLAAEGTAVAFDALEHDLTTRALATTTRWALLGMTVAYPEGVRAGSELRFEPRPEIARATRGVYCESGSRRPLGQTGVMVSPLAISGANELPSSELARARDAGVNTFFWEPGYRTLTEFLARAERKEDLVIIGGTYEADAKTIVRDVERTLRQLRVDSIGAMLLFWVRSPARLSDEAFEALSRLKAQGKVRAIGFSTHLRELAAVAIAERPWDVVMCRHSAAHTTLETTVLPVARARGVGVITFSALVYGRMLTSHDDGPPTLASDCYRYSLSQAGVSVCLSAPRRQRELEENLAVLGAPTLDDTVAARLRAVGEHVRAQNKAFLSLVRG